MSIKLFTIFFFSLLSQSLKSSSQTLDFTYNEFYHAHYFLGNISIQGSATITPNGLLMLTNAVVQETGHAFYTEPLRFKDSPNDTVSSFSTSFVFAIHSEIPILSGHGLAFVIAPNPDLRFASPSQYLGLFNISNDGNDTNHVFAVEFDTIRNTEFNDTNDNHVGIDINSLKSVKSSPAGYLDEKGQFNNLNLISRKRMQVWVDYDGRTNRIDVTMAPFRKDKPREPLVSIVRDLSSVLLQDMYVGFSSATGSVQSEHYVLGWSFRVKGEALPLALSKLPRLPVWVSKSQTLDFTYNGFTEHFYLRNSNISIQGSATIMPNGLLMLTSAMEQDTGHAFYTEPIRFKDFPNDTVSSFSTTFVFAINSQILGGHGLAFVIAPNPDLRFASASQYLGLFNISNNGNDTNHVFAVEFDTVLSPDFNDTNNNHVGIDINSLTSVESSPAGYWDEKDEFYNLTLISGEDIQVWIDYDGHTHRIDVTMALFNENKPRKPLVSIVRDLSSVLLQDMYVGFSSATGSVPSEHYVLGWSFRVKGEAPPLALSKLPILDLEGTAAYKSAFNVNRSWMLLISLLLILLVIIFLVRFILRRRRKFAEELEDWEKEFGKSRLKFKDLYNATKGFKDKNLLGTGGFGSVYRGIMSTTKKNIAVKRVSNESRQGLKEFVAEIVSIGRMSHRNLVPLLGYCRRRDELLLVYDYMPNGSLDKYLYNSPEVTLDWKQRFNVIKGMASALFFLHEEWEQVVIHRDVKASNVLLDAEHNGRLGDFGLARLCGHGLDPQTTNVAGTWGYLAPDHVRTGRATTATDVFAFGVLLLEVACGRRPIEIQNESGERVLLVDWVFGFLVEGNILDAKDPNIGSDYDRREVEMVLKLGLLCSHADPQVRPTMRQVLHYLKGDAMLPDFSPSDLCGGGMMLGINQGLGELATFIGGSDIADSILSGGR